MGASHVKESAAHVNMIDGHKVHRKEAMEVIKTAGDTDKCGKTLKVHQELLVHFSHLTHQNLSPFKVVTTGILNLFQVFFKNLIAVK